MIPLKIPGQDGAKFLFKGFERLKCDLITITVPSVGTLEDQLKESKAEALRQGLTGEWAHWLYDQGEGVTNFHILVVVERGRICESID